MELTKPYADAAYYLDSYQGNAAAGKELDRALYSASETVDALTLCRIPALGDKLTEQQAEKVRRACCMIADFGLEHGDMMGTGLSGYSLNGASVQFSADAPGLRQINGQTVPEPAYSLLRGTGLCYRGVGL